VETYIKDEVVVEAKKRPLPLGVKKEAARTLKGGEVSNLLRTCGLRGEQKVISLREKKEKGKRREKERV